MILSQINCIRRPWVGCKRMNKNPTLMVVTVLLVQLLTALMYSNFDVGKGRSVNKYTSSSSEDGGKEKQISIATTLATRC